MWRIWRLKWRYLLRDPYDVDDALDQREAEVQRKETELRTERQAIMAERSALRAAEDSYRTFLEKNGRAVPPLQLTPERSEHVARPKRVRAAEQVSGGDLDGVTLRVGPQRLRVLEVIARATAEGKSTTNNEIAVETSISPTRISNVLFEDGRRGFLQRKGDEIQMTVRGYEFLRLMQSPAGRLRPQTETPDDPKGARRPDISVEVGGFAAATKTQH